MGVDPREREFITVSRSGISIPGGGEMNIGSLACRQLRNIVATVRGTYADANDNTDPLCLEIFYSPDGQHWDDDSLRSTFLPRGLTLERQISLSFVPPETGYLAAKIRNPDALTVADVSVWMGGRRWADETTTQAAQEK